MLKKYKIPISLKNILDSVPLVDNTVTLQKYKIIDMLVFIAMKCGRKDKTNKKWGYVPFIATQLKERYGKNYKNYINFLITYKYLECSDSYSCGSYSLKYRITVKYIEDDFVDYTVKYKQLKTIKFTIDNNITNVQEYSNLYNDIFRFSINSDAIPWLDSSDLFPSQKSHSYAVLQSIENNNIYFHIDDHRRLHTNLTTLKSFIRKNYLLVDGHNTVEIDIRNSQPAVLGKLMARDGVTNSLFIDDTINGYVYERIMSNMKTPDRKKAKIIAYKAMFGNGLSKRVNTVFNKLYPETFEWLQNKRKELGDYKEVSHLIQTKEAEFIFDILLPCLRSKYPNYPFATIHDSVITIDSADNTDIENIALNLFKNFLL